MVLCAAGPFLERIIMHKREASPATDKAYREIIALKQAGKKFPGKKKFAKLIGVSHMAVEKALDRLKMEREGRVEPVIDLATFPRSLREKMDIALRQHRRKLEAEFTDRVKAESDSRLNEFLLPYWNAKIIEAEEIFASHKGVMTRAVFRKILACLHPDRSMGTDALNEAFNTFRGLEAMLCKVEDTARPAFPKNLAEMVAFRKRSVG